MTFHAADFLNYGTIYFPSVFPGLWHGTWTLPVFALTEEGSVDRVLALWLYQLLVLRTEHALPQCLSVPAVMAVMGEPFPARFPEQRFSPKPGCVGRVTRLT